MEVDELERNIEGEVVASNNHEEVEAFAGLIRSLAEPITTSQIEVAKETTKQTQIISGITKSLLRGVFGIAFSIVLIAAFALFKGEAQLAEKVIFALLGFLGGFGFGKSSNR
ncbi:hypothetical protein [Microbulbifer sp. JSM ZJ756]|uniref:hypothetical protein n=1 Tax=Microbulbifer sp. JSM ZJ756 TaxID=3376191 RepID=UPI00379E6826